MDGFIVNFPVLAVMLFFMCAFIVTLVGRKSATVRNVIAFIAAAGALCMMLALVKPIFIDGNVISYWLGDWEPVEGWAIGIGLEVDALSLFFALIVTVSVFISTIYSFKYMSRDDSLSNYYTLFLMLSGSVLGLVLSGDLFNIFVMIEIMTFTAVALTAFRNNQEGSLEAAFKYLVVGSLGSTCVLVGIALLYSQVHTLNLAQISAVLPGTMNSVTAAAFGFLFIGFATKACMFPFHPMEADAQTVAPASISMMISGVLTKCGVYGIIRLCYCLYQNIDEPFVQYFMTAFGAITMFICVTMAFNQHNFKRLLAFHSLSQVGYVITMVGLGTALGLSSALYHAMNHTIFKSLLFLTAGAVQYSTGSLDLDRLGGLSKRMPRTCALFLIGAASISGLPPFNGFASKWMIYQAAFERGASTGNIYYILICVVCLLTSVLTLASFVKVAHSVFFGQLPLELKDTKEVPVSMSIPMWILAGLCVITGLFPNAVQKYLLTPATTAAMNVGNYIDQMLGSGYAAANGVSTSGTISVEVIGAWNPISWLLLLLSVTCAVALVAVLGSKSDKAVEVSEIEDEEELDPKYESFFSGEESSYSQVGGSDLFWGFKENLKGYFSFMQEWHSGIVNDYTLYGVAAIAVSLVLSLILL